MTMSDPYAWKAQPPGQPGATNGFGSQQPRPSGPRPGGLARPPPSMGPSMGQPAPPSAGAPSAGMPRPSGPRPGPGYGPPGPRGPAMRPPSDAIASAGPPGPGGPMPAPVRPRPINATPGSTGPPSEPSPTSGPPPFNSAPGRPLARPPSRPSGAAGGPTGPPGAMPRPEPPQSNASVPGAPTPRPGGPPPSAGPPSRPGRPPGPGMGPPAAGPPRGPPGAGGAPPGVQPSGPPAARPGPPAGRPQMRPSAPYANPPSSASGSPQARPGAPPGPAQHSIDGGQPSGLARRASGGLSQVGSPASQTSSHTHTHNAAPPPAPGTRPPMHGTGPPSSSLAASGDGRVSPFPNVPGAGRPPSMRPPPPGFNLHANTDPHSRTPSSPSTSAGHAAEQHRSISETSGLPQVVPNAGNPMQPFVTRPRPVMRPPGPPGAFARPQSPGSTASGSPSMGHPVNLVSDIALSYPCAPRSRTPASSSIVTASPHSHGPSRPGAPPLRPFGAPPGGIMPRGPPPGAQPGPPQLPGAGVGVGMGFPPGPRPPGPPSLGPPHQASGPPPSGHHIPMGAPPPRTMGPPPVALSQPPGQPGLSAPPPARAGPPGAGFSGTAPGGMPPPPPGTTAQYDAPPPPAQIDTGSTQPRSPSRNTSRSPRRSPRSPKIDPKKLPRYNLEYQHAPVVFETRTMGSHGQLVHQIPRRADYEVVTKDIGSCAPQYIRVTTNNLPQSKDELQRSHLPLAAVITPLAQPSADSSTIPLIDCGEEGPTRCSRCRAYINPFVRWMDSDRERSQFSCNLCGARGAVSDARLAALQRPEIELGSVEYVAPTSYCVRPPMEAWHLFVVDVTATAMRMGATASVCAAARAAVEALATEERSRVAVMTFDDRVHFYSLKGGATRMIIMPDIEDPYAVPPPSALVNPADPDELAAVTALLDSIPSMFADCLSNTASSPADSEPAASQAALMAAVDLARPNGGKVHMFVSSLPNTGVNRLLPRFRGNYGDTGEASLSAKQDLIAPVDQKWTAAAVSAAESFVCVDFVFLTQGYVDVAQHREWVESTGGTIYLYHPFDPTLDYDELVNDLLWNVRREQGLEALLRVRCSSGIDVETYFGAFLRRETDLVLPAVDCDKSITCMLRHDERLPAGGMAFLQAALLYTTPDGYRRVRVHTLALPVASSLGSVFRGADLDTTLQAAACRTIKALPTTTIAKQREDLESLTVSILTSYRRHCAARSTNEGQLILPESLKLLPLYVCMYFKSPQLASGPLDVRSRSLAAQLSAPPRRFSMSVKPRLLDVAAATQDVGPEGQVVWMPSGYLTVTGECIASDGVYLLENTRYMYLYIGPAAPDSVLLDLLNIPGWHGLPPPNEPLQLPRLDPQANSLNAAANALIDSARTRAGCYMRLRIVCRGRPEERHFHSLVAEDRAADSMSYIEFLCHVHKRISTAISRR